MFITIWESKLQLSLNSLCFSPYLLCIYPLGLPTSTGNNTRVYTRGSQWFSLQAKIVVSNHHSKHLSNGQITMMEICSKSDADPSYHQPLNGDLISSLWEGPTWLFQLVIINAGIMILILKEKWDCSASPFHECTPCVLIQWCVLRWSDTPTSVVCPVWGEEPIW